jgi:hypothetical protein
MKLNKTNLIIIVNVVLFSCTQSDKSINQAYSDYVLKAFYEQGKTYETQVRPILSQEPTRATKDEVFKIWQSSHEKMLNVLKNANNKDVDSNLVNIVFQIINTLDESLLLLKNQQLSEIDYQYFILLERIGSLQLEFELRAKNLKLDIYATGLD